MVHKGQRLCVYWILSHFYVHKMIPGFLIEKGKPIYIDIPSGRPKTRTGALLIGK